MKFLSICCKKMKARVFAVLAGVLLAGGVSPSVHAQWSGGLFAWGVNSEQYDPVVKQTTARGTVFTSTADSLGGDLSGSLDDSGASLGWMAVPVFEVCDGLPIACGLRMDIRPNGMLDEAYFANFSNFDGNVDISGGTMFSAQFVFGYPYKRFFPYASYGYGGAPSFEILLDGEFGDGSIGTVTQTGTGFVKHSGFGVVYALTPKIFLRAEQQSFNFSADISGFDSGKVLDYEADVSMTNLGILISF